MQGKVILNLVAVAAVASVALTSPSSISSTEAGASKYKRGKSSKQSAKVRGYSRRVGGYSYSYADSIIDFRDRSIFLDPKIDQQSGPFDSGFFCESGIERHNDSPYLY